MSLQRLDFGILQEVARTIARPDVTPEDLSASFTELFGLAAQFKPCVKALAERVGESSRLSPNTREEALRWYEAASDGQHAFNALLSAASQALAQVSALVERARDKAEPSEAETRRIVTGTKSATALNAVLRELADAAKPGT